MTRVPSFQGDAISGSGSEEVPGGVLELGGPVFGCGPGGSVVGGADDHELGGLVDVEAGLGALSAPHWWVFGFPCVQQAATKISPVLLSTRMQGSEQPFSFCGFPPCSPMSMTGVGGGPGLAAVFGNAGGRCPMCSWRSFA